MPWGSTKLVLGFVFSHIPDNFPIDIWHGVVWITLASSASYILRDEAEWKIAYTLLADVRTTRVVVTNC